MRLAICKRVSGRKVYPYEGIHVYIYIYVKARGSERVRERQRGRGRERGRRRERERERGRGRDRERQRETDHVSFLEEIRFLMETFPVSRSNTSRSTFFLVLGTSLLFHDSKSYSFVFRSIVINVYFYKSYGYIEFYN
jgi:hypothetical protein